MSAEQGRVRMRLVLSALVCALVLGVIGVASYGRLFSRSAEAEEITPIARLMEQTPELDCSDVEAVDTFDDLAQEPPTWQSADEAARALIRAPGENVDWTIQEPGLGIAYVTDADGEVVRTASLLRMLPQSGWVLDDVTQCVPPSSLLSPS